MGSTGTQVGVPWGEVEIFDFGPPGIGILGSAGRLKFSILALSGSGFLGLEGGCNSRFRLLLNQYYGGLGGVEIVEFVPLGQNLWLFFGVGGVEN